MIEPKPGTLPATLTVQEVAAILRRSENSIIAAINNGELPGKKLGRVYRIPKVTFDRWLFAFDEKPRRRSPEGGSGW